MTRAVPAAPPASASPVSLEQALAESEQRFLGLLEIGREALLIVRGQHVVLASTAACALLGVEGPASILGHSVLEFFMERYRPAVADRLAGLESSDATAPFVHRVLVRPDGVQVHVEIALHACRFHGEPAVQMLVRDVSASQSLQAQLTRLTQNDALTELANRSQLFDRLEGAIARATRNKVLLGFLCIGLDRFRNANDAFGQKGGDVLLMQTAERLKQNARKSDTLARLGSDEFCVILEGLVAKDGAAIAAERTRELLARPHLLDSREVVVTASVGIAVFPADATDFNSLVQKASLAMRYAKQQGRNQCRFYEPGFDAMGRDQAQQRLEIEQRTQRLTPRERDVLELLVAGKASKMIAYTLGISSRTVDIHRGRVMDKMQADSLAELVHMVRELKS